MEKLVLFFLPLFFACSFGEKKSITNENVQEPTVYYFIRHAEKDTANPDDRDPELNQLGKERAQKWVQVFKDIPFDMIYSSDYKRTRSTAQAIADSQEKEVSIYDARKLNDEDFQKKTKGKRVLVVGHSNSNPHFVNLILEENKYQNIPDEESGSLFIVTVLPDGTKSSEVIYIN